MYEDIFFYYENILSLTIGVSDKFSVLPVMPVLFK
ncbi:hypothetical protein SAMN05518672_114114 [Chitinophaga sp. CF118]|nr:hypothetical protein SAMN05518672_114114 [Chitinophaga sp. CF118]